MEEVCFNVTSQLKMQECKTAMFSNGKLHSIGYNSRPDSRTIFYCNHCEYQRTSSYKHSSSVLNKRSKNGHHSLRTRTFNEIEKLSRLTFNMPYFAVSFLNYIVSLFFMTILSRLLSSWRYNCKGTFLHYLLIFYGVSLFSSCNVLGEEVAFMSTQAQRKLIDSSVPVGMGFVYTIPNRIFDCKVQRLEVSEGSSRTLPQWLAFDEGKQTFYGVPSATDIGSYEILVVALAKSDSKTGKICGMKAFTIYVSSEDKSPSFAGPILESVSIAAGSSESLPSTISKHFACFPGLQTVFATVIISADMHELGGHKRMGILRRMAQHMNISFNKLALFHREDKHPLIEQLENPSIIVSGSGDGRYKKGPKSIVTWKITCGALRLGPTYLTELETSAQDGTISNVLGYPVVGWHVTSGVQKAKHRARRAAVAGTPTPTATAILPTQVNNMSTVIITDSISLTTAFVAPNSTLMPSSTLQVSSTVSVAMSSTLPVNRWNFTSSMPITTVAVTSTPVLSSLNWTIFKSVTSSIVNVSSQVDTSSISITVNGTSANVMSTVVDNSSVVAYSSVTSFVNATSATSSPVLNSSFVLELENTTISILNSSSSIMRSTVYSITPSPSIFLPENSTVVNSTFSTSFPGTNFSATSLNLTQKSSVFMSSVRRVNSSTVIPVLPSTVTILPSSVALKSSVFMNQTSTIQPSFQTSTFLSSSPTLTSSLPGNVTNLTSSASLMVSNTSAVILSSTITNATDEVVKTTMVNSSSVVSLVQMLSSLPVMTSVNISTVLPTTVVNTSLVDATSYASPLVGNTSVLSVILSTMSPNATKGLDISTNISRVLPSTSREIRNTTSFSSVSWSTMSPNATKELDMSTNISRVLPSTSREKRNTFSSVFWSTSTVSPSATSGLEASTNVSRMMSTMTLNTSSSLVYPATTSSDPNLTSVTSMIYLTNSSTLVFNSTVLQTTSFNKTIEIPNWSSTVDDEHITTILPTATATHNWSSSLVTITETMNASRRVTPSIELSRTVDLINTTTVLPPFTTGNTTLSPALTISHMIDVNSTKQVLTSFATVSTLALNSTLHDFSSMKKSSSFVVNNSVTSIFPSINSTSLLQPSPMTSRFLSGFVNSTVTNSSEVFRTGFQSTTASVAQNYTSSLVITPAMTTLNTTPILTDKTTAFPSINSTSLLQPSPMTSRFLSGFVNSTVTNASEVFRTGFLSTTASVARNYTSSFEITPTMTTLNTTPILTDKTTAFPSITSTSLLQASPMTSRFSTGFVNSTVTNASDVFRTGFLSTTASVAQNYTSSFVITSTMNTTSILTDNRASVSQISRTLVTINMTTILLTQNDTAEPTTTQMIRNSTSVLPKESEIQTSALPSSSMTQVNSSSTRNWPSMSTPNLTSSSVLSVVQSNTLELLYTSRDVNSTVVSGVSTSPVFSTSGVIPSGTDNVTMTTVSPSSVVMETPILYPNVTTSNVSTVPITSSLNISHMVVSSSGVVMETESTVVIKTQTPYPTVTPSNASTVPLSSSLTPPLNTSSIFGSSSGVVMETESTVVIKTQTPYPTVTPSNTSTVPLSSSLTPPLNTSSIFVSSSGVVMETESTVVIKTQTTYPTVTPSNTSTVPLSSSLTPPLNTSSIFGSSSGVVMETESTVVIKTQTTYPTVTPSNAFTVPLSSSFSPFLSSSLPVVTSSVIMSPNLTSATTTTPLIEKTQAPNVSSLVLTATTVKSSSPAVLPSTPSVPTTSLSTQTISSSSINSTTAVVSSSVYQASSTVTSVPSLNATTIAVIPTVFSSLSSSSLLEETRTTITSNGTTLYPITTTVLVSSVQPSSTLVVTTSPQVETTALQTSSVFNSSVTSTFVSSTMKPSFVPSATSFSILTSVVTSEISTLVIPSITWIENSTVITPFTSDLPHTSSSLISSIVVSSAEISTISLVSQTTSTLVPTTPTPNKPPQVHNDIGRLTATAGKVFRYAIPEDVFYDEDGNTSSLTLSLTRINEEFTAEDLGNTSWLVFDAEKQEMYGLPMKKDVPSDPERGEKFLLTARDSAGLGGYDAFEIMIRTSSLAYTQSLSIRLDNDFSAFEQNISQRLDLVSRISGYYGDSDTSQVRVLSYNQGSILFSWTNDSLPTDVCNTTQVNYVAEKVIERDGVNTAFKEHLSPEYTVTDASRTLTGVCNATTLPPPLVPDKVVGTEPSGLWEKHVLPGIIVAVILIIIAVLLLLLFLRRRRAKPADPEKRTYKKRKPIILEPEMEMKPRSGKPLILENDELSMPPSYMSEISLDKTLYDDSDDYDEDDYKPTPSRSSPMYETPPPEYIVPRGPLEQPPPAYRLPPTFYSSYTLPPWETSSDV